MADIDAQQLIAIALVHSMEPAITAIEALDRAMRGYEDADLDFDAGPGYPFDNWLDPPSPFADLLRLAFAPHITAEQTALWYSDDPLLAKDFREMWDADVIQPFEQRYRLWQA